MTGQHPWRAKLLRIAAAVAPPIIGKSSRPAKSMFANSTAQIHAERIDAVIAPPNGLPRCRITWPTIHSAGCVFAFVPSLLGLPAGNRGGIARTPGRRHGANVLIGNRRGRTYRADNGCIGLPVGVQVASRLWRDDVCMAVMHALEAEFRNEQDYPLRTPAR